MPSFEQTHTRRNDDWAPHGSYLTSRGKYRSALDEASLPSSKLSSEPQLSEEPPSQPQSEPIGAPLGPSKHSYSAKDFLSDVSSIFSSVKKQLPTSFLFPNFAKDNLGAVSEAVDLLGKELASADFGKMSDETKQSYNKAKASGVGLLDRLMIRAGTLPIRIAHTAFNDIKWVADNWQLIADISQNPDKYSKEDKEQVAAKTFVGITALGGGPGVRTTKATAASTYVNKKEALDMLYLSYQAMKNKALSFGKHSHATEMAEKFVDQLDKNYFDTFTAVSGLPQQALDHIAKIAIENTGRTARGKFGTIEKDVLISPVHPVGFETPAHEIGHGIFNDRAMTMTGLFKKLKEPLIELSSESVTRLLGKPSTKSAYLPPRSYHSGVDEALAYEFGDQVADRLTSYAAGGNAISARELRSLISNTEQTVAKKYGTKFDSYNRSDLISDYIAVRKAKELKAGLPTRADNELLDFLDLFKGTN